MAWNSGGSEAVWDGGRSHGVACRAPCPGSSPWDLGECSFPVRDPEQLPYRVMTCVIRAWDCRKPLLFCPAMNTVMWEHPITAQQLGQLKAFGYVEIPCVAKKLVCGDQGLGAMAEVGTIVDKVKEVLFQHGGSQHS
ncbi:phosphopantothenoylcysteine decarboxylase isoform X5 [Lutra lutra]|uniref:phosphopantothenoylcysteine decarboxylase isoform X5 n=1 Tax=Lutra lutra TaxID=9657 RepID=UPI001FD4028F|nr:phosphopantothenoylcysteine decarboxylase isoform X5 [Lutra lutra]XP_047592514.1 phosphopantothenoylcysteine decarboxylase isoform X5 [Lutra lutra]